MNYYLAFFLITENGQIFNSGTLPYHSKNPYPIDEVKNLLSDYLIGHKFDDGQRRAIVLLNLQKLTQEEYDQMDKDLKLSD